MKIRLSELRRVVREVVQEEVNLQEVGRLDVTDRYMSAVAPEVPVGGDEPVAKGALMAAADSMQIADFLMALEKTLGAQLGSGPEAVAMLNNHLRGVLSEPEKKTVAGAYESREPSVALKGTGYEHDDEAQELLNVWANSVLG